MNPSMYNILWAVIACLLAFALILAFRKGRKSHKKAERTILPLEGAVAPRLDQAAHVLMSSPPDRNVPPPDFASVIDMPPPSYQDHSKDPKITASS
ncbi:hypothetical protein BY458DRAFT_527322 [Sporodiniella umbellata]|nr:hypothetical protein BY458DRAFT_527322 [Sporodiniella umbellata]